VVACYEANKGFYVYNFDTLGVSNAYTGIETYSSYAGTKKGYGLTEIDNSI
jgi:hypothetical protein